METNQQQTPKPLTGPYRATRLWNEALRIFNNGVPRKRHWRQLRQYENCFTAAEATTWLHGQLRSNPHFGPGVSKDQVQQLLCKFLKVGVFEDVRGSEAKVEHFKENTGLYRLTNRSPFRNPRTPGRTPLGTLSNRGNQHGNNEDTSGSPKLSSRNRQSGKGVGADAGGSSSAASCGRALVQCQLTARQLNQEEVEEIWKNATIRQIARVLGLFNVKGFLDPNHLKGKWVLWNVTRIGTRGVVQPMEEMDSPPSWVLYGMKSLVNWPANENHKLPDYRGSERDVFQVICDYFTNASGPLTTFSLYNLLVEAFIRAEAADLQFRQANKDPVTDNAENEGDGDGSSSGSTSTLSSRSSSVQSLVMKMASPAVRKTSTPLNQPGPHPSSGFPLEPVIVKSPIMTHRSRALRTTGIQRHPTIADRAPSGRPIASGVRRFINERSVDGDDDACCYETAFTTAEPQTRMVIRQSRLLTLPRRSQSSELILEESSRPSGGLAAQQQNPAVYRSLDRLRSKSGGYVNVAAFGSADCLLDQMDGPRSPLSSTLTTEWRRGELWTPSTASIRSISSLSSQQTSAITGLSPPSTLMNSTGPTAADQEAWGRHFRPKSEDESPPSGSASDGQKHLRSYRNSPSKRLVGRRKGLEFYYGAKACRPGLVTPEGKAMAVESLQLLTLLLPPDLRRKLHLLLRFMAKVSANRELVLDPGIPLKTLMINTFYRCIVCSADDTDYDELLAVRLVTFLMDNAEAIMVVPHRLCVQVRDTLLDLQREKIRFQPDDVFPLAFCRQVSPRRFEMQKETESDQAVRQLLDVIVADQKMSLREKRKRLKQFRAAYPEIYYNKFPQERPKTEEVDAPKASKRPAVIDRIRSIRLL